MHEIVQHNDKLFLKIEGKLMIRVYTFKLNDELIGYKALVKKGFIKDSSKPVKISKVTPNYIIVETENRISTILRENHIECLLIELS
ncbi:hypothetical protein B5V88_06315 [Heyndrickxia sporothermodurans]|uniref:Uncharacterized protein n=1 Tax=Heyndrickxia sporothermodurans TaxID=46224 RepID=A0AB37HDC5_9BACI|nr:hypothetical protein [Heyndrickxia sporothermodurans]MBL5766564.1 hypothetical protein [Heyndrickxia sporothermodurans]MBL5770003.1 hypothetical protein [Heyndrickxia sporothermodurans]MBL5773680.1 hypothetical protein [Heyndrickxia sporothermodurans]MBL5777334.1 hypothetical protein [Heyndrickxia sporothermodurans]MBL5780766.1 hypothetical protein [Heyndrickxia sporothermodurans]